MPPQPKQFSYEIGGRVYLQRKLKLDQIVELATVLADWTPPAPPHTQTRLAASLGRQLRPVLGVILVPEGETVETKDSVVVAQAIGEMDAETLAQVVRDFFDCNRVSSVVALLTEALAVTKASRSASTATSPGLPGVTPSEAGGSGSIAPSTNVSPAPAT